MNIYDEKKKNLKSYQVTMRLSGYYIISHDRLWNNFVYKIKRKRYLILSYFNLAGNITFTFAKIFLTTQKNQTCKHEIISETFPHKRATLQTTTSDQERDKIDILIFFSPFFRWDKPQFILIFKTPVVFHFKKSQGALWWDKIW